MFDVKNFANGMYKVNNADAKKWAKEQAKFIAKNPEYTSAYELDFGLCIAMGFQDGFDPDFDGGDIVNPDYPSAHLCMKICEYKPYDLDFEYLYMPYSPNTGDVWDTDTSVTYDTIDSTVDWLINEYYEIVEQSTYEVTISFNGVEMVYDTDYLSTDEAKEEALELAVGDLSVLELSDNGGTVVFCDDSESAQYYNFDYITPSDDAEARDELIDMASSDLEIVSVEADWIW